MKGSKHLSLSGSLRPEVECRRFLDSWYGCVRWRTQKHKQVVFSDASLYKYGGRVEYEKEVIEISNFWEHHDDRKIHHREAKIFKHYIH